ncbi:uncharacterized protein Eint_110375 [Encephalitozoon intestinalis ATCC 50506]|uniref:Uncharacterized protein n=1 Tax=Encephalitozoon intestinalis (strain ATCC 50506) TaxID=876142 RepID=W8PGV5_ENCIT|nr:uncharacterized protein Eint_110375 [Encephalitozoon intestinalis ATCC 50506]AHL30166.1 hypothetical protein Eint_110375 [Encephalitozoon intestinalis ATCC 50506]UTX46392.1 hypothetical protein GPK93_11g19990 [Encephalitozoon intestinalis]
MNVRESFISTRKTNVSREDSEKDCYEEEYYKWRIRDLKRKIRDIRKEIIRAKNIGTSGNDPKIY